MPEEVFVLAMTALISGAVVLIAVARSVVGYHTAKLQSRNQSRSGDELTAGELQRLVRAAVEESIEPLVEKIDRLESQRAPRALQEPRTDVLQDDFDEPPAAEPVLRRGRSR
jgi:hypothetical protein